MSIWNTYPNHYRRAEAGAVLAAIEAGECAAVVGLSGSGKSNLLGFLTHRAGGKIPLVQIDCNRMQDGTPAAFYKLALDALGAGGATDLQTALAERLAHPPGRLGLVIDRFDAIPPASLPAVHGNLRALRDDHKYALSLVIATRHPLEPGSELAELFFGHTVWLGPLSLEDACWSAAQFSARHNLDWEDAVLARLAALSGGYPSFLRATCEAYAAGTPLDLADMRQAAPVRHRLAEFWADQPAGQVLALSHLTDNPLLVQPARSQVNTSGLTAGELRLLEHLQAHAGTVCSKDDLARAIWPEEKVFGDGIRDDSLAQLVRRLREKIEADPSAPRLVVTAPGRGYKWNP
jgi:energy-coupling factor transporter ATP-binding protein EcfA2